MISQLYEELKPLQERMHRKSKKVFREYLFKKAKSLGFDARIYPNSVFSKNVVVGDVRTAKTLLCAHYDTPPRLPVVFAKHTLLLNIVLLVMLVAAIVLDIILGGPLFIGIVCIVYLYVLGFLGFSNKTNFNDNSSGVLTLLLLMEALTSKDVAFVFFDNEEKGLVGSLDFIRAMKKDGISFYSKQAIIFDCVGRGQYFGLSSFSKNTLPKKLLESFEVTEEYEVFERKGSLLEVSDHYVFQFMKHCGIFCYEKKKGKYVLEDIHSSKDKEINLMNILYLAQAMKKYIDKEYVV